MFLNKRFVYVDSNKRLNGTHSNFFFDLDIKSFGDYDTVCLASCNIPKSYYLIEVGENTFTLREDVHNILISIPAANYTRTTLRTTLQQLLNDNSVLGIAYTITSSPSTQGDTGKYTFTCKSNGAVQPAFIFTTYLTEQLGFNANSTNNFVDNTLESVNVIKLQLEDSVFIHSSLVNNGNDDILQDINVVNNPAYGNITWLCPSFDVFSKRVAKPEKIAHFRITDEANNELDTNGLNCVFCLILYKSENVNKLLKQVLKYNVVKDAVVS
jgi:hypothetical protein